MTSVRCAAGLAAVVSAMLVQATVIGPLVYPVPVSLPLLVVVAVAVLSGPGTGLALGFGAGLLADLNAHHPVGVLALVWLGAGVVAGILGGLVMEPGRAARPANRSRTRVRSHGRERTPRKPSEAGAGELSRWRAQALLTGMVSVAATGAALLLLAVVGSAPDTLPGALALLIPSGLLDAMLAVAVLALTRAMLRSAALQPVVPVGLGATASPAVTPPGWPMELR